MDERWLQEFEKKIDLLLNRFEISFLPPQIPEHLKQVVSLAAKGNKIDAIELYRYEMGAPLENAQKFVDGLMGVIPRYERINLKLELLLNRFEISFESKHTPDPVYEAIRVYLLAGNKIEAIKVYREVTGTGLKEAKDVVDSIERDLRA
jgi:ribosomal protein L7/L12